MNRFHRHGYLNRGLSRGNVVLPRVLLRGPAGLTLLGAAGIPHRALPGPLAELLSSPKQRQAAAEQMRRGYKTVSSRLQNKTHVFTKLYSLFANYFF